MSNDIDFDQLIDLLDRAITSKDPKVMQALKKFLFIAALATEDTEEKGPFANLIERIERLEQQVAMNPGTYTYPDRHTVWYGSGVGTGGCVGGGTTTAVSPNTHKYLNTGSTSSSYSFSDYDLSNFTTTPTYTTITSSAEARIDEALEDLQKMADDSLAK